MNSLSRAALAYVVGRYHNKMSYSSLFSFAESKYHLFSGFVDERSINVYHYEEKCYITGSSSMGNISLYYYGLSAYITITYVDSSYSCYDYSNNAYINIKVNGNNLIVYDFSEIKYFNYILN